MEDAFVLSVDQGTTGTTVLIADLSEMKNISILGRSTVEFPQYYPKTDWVEHDLNEIWDSVVKAIEESCQQAEQKFKHFHRKKIRAIGITNQRETLCIYDRNTLTPLRRAIVWQCKRSSSICQRIRKDGYEDVIRNKTGLFVDPYFTGTKLTWVLENEPEIARKIKNGEARIGTIDTFLISKFGAGKDYATEASNASRTLMFNIHTGTWDSELVSFMGLNSTNLLAEIKNSTDVFTHTKGLSFLPDGIPITGVLGDQQAALAGQHCFNIGEAKCTYGTGAFLLLNIGNEVVISQHKLLTTVAWQINEKRTYALEGSSFIAGAAFQFLRDNLKFFKSVSEIESLAKDTNAAPDIYFVPALSGLACPWWEPNAKGAFLGLTRSTSMEQLIRACVEGVAFQVMDLIESMRLDSKKDFQILRVDGGAASNSLLLQIQSQFSGLTVERPHFLETTGMGALLFAALGSGLISSIEEIKNSVSIDKIFTPSHSKLDLEKTKIQKQGWEKAIKAVCIFSEK